jgi:hypothetical protein
MDKFSILPLCSMYKNECRAHHWKIVHWPSLRYSPRHSYGSPNRRLWLVGLHRGLLEVCLVLIVWPNVVGNRNSIKCTVIN